MKKLSLVAIAFLPLVMARQGATKKVPSTMTKMVVRLGGPGIAPGSIAAMPKTIFRAGEDYVRIEDPPDARQKIQKLTIITGHDAYSVNLIDRRGTHAVEQSGTSDMRVPVVLPFDSKHRLGKLDSVEFGAEYDFFVAAGAQKINGPMINAKATDAYVLQTPLGTARLIMRPETHTPIYLRWDTPEGPYQYEYIAYEEVPFQSQLFTKPVGITWKEIASDPGTG